MSLARLGLIDGYEGQIDPHRQFTRDEMRYDDILCEAVKAFQQSRGIVPTGAIDDARALFEAATRVALDLDPGTLKPRGLVDVAVHRADRTATRFQAVTAIETSLEIETLSKGGLLPLILDATVRRSAV